MFLLTSNNSHFYRLQGLVEVSTETTLHKGSSSDGGDSIVRHIQGKKPSPHTCLTFDVCVVWSDGPFDSICRKQPPFYIPKSVCSPIAYLHQSVAKRTKWHLSPNVAIVGYTDDTYEIMNKERGNDHFKITQAYLQISSLFPLLQSK